jgi:hypothetical protein
MGLPVAFGIFRECKFTKLEVGRTKSELFDGGEIRKRAESIKN